MRLYVIKFFKKKSLCGHYGVSLGPVVVLRPHIGNH